MTRPIKRVPAAAAGAAAFAGAPRGAEAHHSFAVPYDCDPTYGE
jgi:hypothetical protein